MACSATKGRHATRAEELYTSDLFLKASAYAKANSDVWYILSAKHGLLMPSRVVHPYDRTLNRLTKARRQQWATSVIESLRPRLKPGDCVLILAGSRYREHIVPWLLCNGFKVDMPLEGLGIGKQKAWLKRRIGR